MKWYYVYRHYDKNGVLLYVGATYNWAIRYETHKYKAAWNNDLTWMKIERYDTKQKALLAEKKAIIKENPMYNNHHNLSLKAEVMIEKQKVSA